MVRFDHISNWLNQQLLIELSFGSVYKTSLYIDGLHQLTGMIDQSWSFNDMLHLTSSLDDHILKTSKREGNCNILTSINLAIKSAWKLKLLYPLLFINIYRGTNWPISVHQHLQPANINVCWNLHKTWKNGYENTHFKGKTLCNCITVSYSFKKKYNNLLLGEIVHLQNKWTGKTVK